MSEQQTEALLSTIDALVKERTELREALTIVLSWMEAKCHDVCFAHDAVSRCAVCKVSEQARAVLAKGK